MTMRLLDVDDRLLEEARRLLGATTAREAVNRSLAEVVRCELGRRGAASRPGRGSGLTRSDPGRG